MNFLKLFFVTLFVTLLSGCMTERTVIPRGYNVVYSQIDWFFFDQQGGMSDRILQPGKQELSTGYNTLYFVPTTQDNYPVGNISILMKEKVARKFKIDIGYKLVKGASLKLVLNYLPVTDAQKVSSEILDIDKINVDIKSVFKTNILPFAMQVIMDTIDNESLYLVNTESMAVIIDRKLKGLLSKVLIMEHIVDKDGNIVLSGNTISITDVIDINTINIVPGPMPDVVKKEVNDLTNLQADLKQANEDLKIETVIKHEEMMNSAANIKGENDALVTLLDDDKFARYQKLLQIKDIVEPKYDSDGNLIKTDSKTKIYFYQKGMKAKDVADLVRTSN